MHDLEAIQISGPGSKCPVDPSSCDSEGLATLSHDFTAALHSLICPSKGEVKYAQILLDLFLEDCVTLENSPSVLPLQRRGDMRGSEPTDLEPNCL